MKSLEGMALERFNDFCQKETGKSGNWSYLSDERKLAWMKEVLVMAYYFHKEVLADIKPLPTNQKFETVYASGHSDGIRSERSYLLSLFQRQFDKLLDEYQDFKYKLDNN